MPNSKGPRHGTREKLSNDPRDRGISPPQRSIESFDPGQKVHLRIDPSIPKGQFYPRYNGHTGEVVEQQGNAYKIRIDDNGKEKLLIAAPAHLTAQKQE
jgi:large subunit ribosomal protein L21e